MKRFSHLSQAVLLLVCSALLTFGQAAPSNDSNNIVPRLVRFSGAFTDTNGKPPSSAEGVTFSLYKDSQGGAPLWIETQNVQPDSKGHYTVLLGSTKPDGVTSDLFASGEARWLGVQPQGQAEQPRVLMVSVPYALKAVDADTLGGMPASAFQLALPQALGGASAGGRQGSASLNAGSSSSNKKDVTSANNPPCAASSNYIPFWNTYPTLCNSEIYQASNNYVGVNRTTPLVQFDVSGAINAEPIASQANSGNFGILKTPVLSIGWPESHVVPSNGNLYVGSLAGGQGVNTADNGFPNTFVGYSSGVTNTSGIYNSFLGYNSGAANTSGSSNTFLGHQSGLANTTGNYNSFLGTGSGKANTIGTENTFLGYRSGYANTNGKANAFLGYQSGFANTNGSSNTFLGPQSGFTNTSGAEDTFVGLQSGYSNTTGVSNTFLGLQSGFADTTGGANTFLGAGACSNITTGSGDICIGYGVSAPNNATSATILVGTEGAQTAAYVAGIYGETIGSTHTPVCVDNTGKLGTTPCTGTGGGTVTSVGSGLGLTGGPITTSGTLKIDTTVVPLLNTPNTFTGNQTVNGTVSGNSSTAEAILGISSVDNTGCPSIGCAGVVGLETGVNNDTIGVYGFTASPVGAGVYGQSVSASSVLFSPPDPSAAIWGDSSAQFGILGTSDLNTAVYGLNQTINDPYSPTAYFENDSNYDTDVVLQTSGFNNPNPGGCIVDTAGDLSCDRTISAQNISNGSGGSNTDLAGSCTLTAGTCNQPFTLPYSFAPVCVATDTTAVNPVQVVVTPTSLTINGSNGDVANYICIGRDNPPPKRRGLVHDKLHHHHSPHAAAEKSVK